MTNFDADPAQRFMFVVVVDWLMTNTMTASYQADTVSINARGDTCRSGVNDYAYTFL